MTASFWRAVRTARRSCVFPRPRRPINSPSNGRAAPSQDLSGVKYLLHPDQMKQVEVGPHYNFQSGGQAWHLTADASGLIFIAITSEAYPVRHANAGHPAPVWSERRARCKGEAGGPCRRRSSRSSSGPSAPSAARRSSSPRSRNLRRRARASSRSERAARRPFRRFFSPNPPPLRPRDGSSPSARPGSAPSTTTSRRSINSTRRSKRSRA